MFQKVTYLKVERPQNRTYSLVYINSGSNKVFNSKMLNLRADVLKIVKSGCLLGLFKIFFVETMKKKEH